LLEVAMMKVDDVRERVRELHGVLDVLPAQLLEDLMAAAAAACVSLRNRGVIYFFGNGGSAATAEHLASELVGRFQSERPPMRAGVLTASGVVLTALANDYPGDELFARQVRGVVDTRDTLVALSASGRSPNILRALDEGVRIGCTRIGFTGNSPAEFSARCDWVFAIPSQSVPRIQEVHMMLGHVFCELIENIVGDAP
jgi:D-sedoheptulose 7-phosphate isomerase